MPHTYIYTQKRGERGRKALQFRAVDSLGLHPSPSCGGIHSCAGRFSSGMKPLEDKNSDPAPEEELRPQAAVVDDEEAVLVVVVVVEIVAFHPNDDQEETLSQRLVAYHSATEDP